MSGEALDTKEWRRIDKLGDPTDLKGDALKRAADAVLALPIDEDSPIPKQLLQALRVAQAALQGERKRAEEAEDRADAGASGSSGALQRARAEAQAQSNKVRALEEQLEQTDLELQDKRDEVEELNSLLEAAGADAPPRTRLTPSASVGRLGNEVEELKEELQDLRVQKRDLIKDLARKEEQYDRARLQLEEAKEQMREDANERRQVRPTHARTHTMPTASHARFLTHARFLHNEHATTVAYPH